MEKEAPTVYAVFRVGVYRHECGGIFASLAAATYCAERLAEADSDDYHTYEVVPFRLDAATPIEPGDWTSPRILESDALFNCRKGDAPHDPPCE